MDTKVATSWVLKNCKFAGGLAGTPHSPTMKGTMGFSRVFDLAYHMLQSLGLKNLDKDAHVATFGFEKSAKPEHQIRLSWAGFDDPASPAIKIKIIENDPNKIYHNWLDLAYQNCGKTKEACTRDTDFIIRTDSLHSTPGGAEFTSMCYDAFHKLQKMTNQGLTDRARFGQAMTLGELAGDGPPIREYRSRFEQPTWDFPGD